MKANHLHKHDWDVTSMKAELERLHLKYIEAGGQPLAGYEIKQIFVDNVGDREMKRHLVAAPTIQAMADLVRLAQLNGVLPKKGSGATGDVFPSAAPTTAFVTESSPSQDNSQPQDNNSRRQGFGNGRRGKKREILCGGCNLWHIAGDYHCTVRCTHCQKANHSASECTKRKRDAAFRKSQQRKLKNVLLTNCLRAEERRSQEEQRGRTQAEGGQRHPSQDVRQLDLVRQVRLEEQTRANQAIVNHVYHTRRHDQQSGRAQRDRRGSFSEHKEVGRANDVDQSALSSDVDIFQGVFDKNFHQGPDFQRQ
jgi:hypothetical protein